MKTKWILAAAFWISGFGAISAQTIEAVPAHILFDESSTIRAKALPPNEHISIRGELVDGAGHTWTSEAEFVADDAGIVDTSKQAPTKGSYKEASSMGAAPMVHDAKGKKCRRIRTSAQLRLADYHFSIAAKWCASIERPVRTARSRRGRADDKGRRSTPRTAV